MTLNRRLATERACVFGVLRDFDLLDLLAEGGTVAIMLSVFPLRSSSRASRNAMGPLHTGFRIYR